MLETVALEHVPPSHSVHIAFFKSVSNAGFLQSQLLARNADFEYAFIDATTIVSRLQVLAATYKALSVLLNGKLKSPNVHGETVLALSASNNVSHSYSCPGWPTRTVTLRLHISSPPPTLNSEPSNIQTFARRFQKHIADTASPPTSRTSSS